MKRLEDLPQITDEVLGGLQATPGLQARILEAAAAPAKRKILTVPRVAAVLGAAAVAAGAALTLTRLPAPTASTAYDSTVTEPVEMATPVIYSASAGDDAAAEQESDAVLLAAGSESVTVRSKSASSADSIWADAEGGSFPMICVSGRCYRLLTSPAGISSSLLGSELGTVDEYTDEPALSGENGIMSNICPAGTAVHAVEGMSGTLAAASIDGSIRVFQRVSFNGTALKGKEKLADTLKLKGHITGMTLSGTGTVDDPAACEKLFGILTSSASYESSGSLSGKQLLQIQLDNGITVQMVVKGDKLAACGVWSCPEFMEAFAAQAK